MNPSFWNAWNKWAVLEGHVRNELILDISFYIQIQF